MKCKDSGDLKKQLKYDDALLQKSFLDFIWSFSELMEARDAYTANHQKRVALLALNIAIKAKITDLKILNAVYYGALIHDIGKVAVPIDYLVTPRCLTEHEFAVIKAHPTTGNKIIEHLDFPWDIKSVVYQHHERIDGTGYPNGLKGEQITIPAKIVAVADVYEAMSTNRPYRKVIEREVVYEHLKENRGIQFDARIIDYLFQCLSDLPDIYSENPNFKRF